MSDKVLGWIRWGVRVFAQHELVFFSNIFIIRYESSWIKNIENPLILGGRVRAGTVFQPA